MNFWKACGIFWILWLFVFSLNYLLTWDSENLWRILFTMVMAAFFLAAGAVEDDKKLLKK